MQCVACARTFREGAAAIDGQRLRDRNWAAVRYLVDAGGGSSDHLFHGIC